MSSRLVKFDLNLTPAQRKRGTSSPRKRLDGETSSAPRESEKKRHQETAPHKDPTEICLGFVKKRNEDKMISIYSQPIEDPIWRGCFKISGDIYGRIAAHLSDKACPRILQEATTLKPFLHFEKLPKAAAWPRNFAISPPTDDNISLYFFPETERDENLYNDLLDETMSRELVLRASVGRTELLIFTSLELPQSYWRIFGKCYLWGLFRERQNPLPKASLIINLSNDEEDSKGRSDRLQNKSSRLSTYPVSDGQYGSSQTIQPARNLKIGDVRNLSSLQTDRFPQPAFRSYSQSYDAPTPLARLDIGTNSRATQLTNLQLHGDTTVREREKLLNNRTSTDLVLFPLEAEMMTAPPGKRGPMEAKR
ncbi:protein PARALOG OF AIPP2-like [Aristolochia californica]|uniref:protein PARALOG OF AIPP2-like n=1 Tax=Aristolochia californica TaxID=171875 RepID=UPI0035DD4E83